MQKCFKITRSIFTRILLKLLDKMLISRCNFYININVVERVQSIHRQDFRWNFSKNHNPHLVPIPMWSNSCRQKKIDKFKKYSFFPKINMLLQATYFSTINPQFVGLLTHILHPPPTTSPASQPRPTTLP